MGFEVIVKYNGDILKLEKEMNIDVELLGQTYAILTLKYEQQISELLNYSEIEYIEEPFILNTQDIQSFSSTGINNFKNETGLTGKGTLIGIIDSGIDYTIQTFKDINGNSKILYYWDQSMKGNPPENFKEGSLYTNEDMNKALKGEINIPIATTSSHGTHVASICSEIAPQANLIVVKVGNKQTDNFSRSTEFMRAIKFILDTSLKEKMPVSINISYGSNEGSHRGLSLFERYIDDMSLYWKNNICVASGNNANKGGHKHITIENSNVEVEFAVGEREPLLNLNIWPNFADDFEVYLVSPSNEKTPSISIKFQELKTSISSTTIKGYFYSIPPYSLSRRVTFVLSSNKQIITGIWKIVIVPINIVDGNIDIYLPTSQGLSESTKFLNPTKELTATVPGTAKSVITVGSYNSRTDTVSVFSGIGDMKNNLNKPDILAPGEDIVADLPGGSKGALSGTSMATPHVTGVCSLLMEWGIVRKNDLFMYGERLKYILLKFAKRRNDLNYPNDMYGYGFLNLRDIDLDSIENSLKSRKGNTRKIKKKDICSKRFIENSNVKNLEYRDVYELDLGINIIFNEQFESDLLKLDIKNKFIKISNSYGVIFLKNFKDIESINNLKSIKRMEYTTFLVPLANTSPSAKNGVSAVEEIGAKYFHNNSNVPITGRGVIIGIVDTGIDYLHPDFIYEDDTSKILYLWDQSKEGNPPKNYCIGTEYSNNQINEAIKNKDTDLCKDEDGHGTMISGIISGMGKLNQEYIGVAPESELIVVKLKKINNLYTNAMVFAANKYIVDKANELNKPVVLAITLGGNFLTGIVDRRISPVTYFSQGISIVSAAGNEGDTQTHASGKLSFTGEEKEVVIEIVEKEKNLQLQLWISKPDKVNVSISSPSGEISKEPPVVNYTESTGLFDLEGTEYTIRYNYPTTFSGQEFVQIHLKNATSGLWTIKLKGERIINGVYNMFLPNNVLLNKGTKFRESDPFYTINYPATNEDFITVGGYDSINKSLWKGSSRGDNLQGNQSPDIVAPSVNIIAPYPNNSYGTITGTSAGSAHVVGAIALYLQYTLVDGNYKQKAYSQMIRTYLAAGAKKNSSIKYPNESFGYGILDIRGMFNQFK